MNPTASAASVRRPAGRRWPHRPGGGRPPRAAHRDAGSATAELAAALPAWVLLLVAGLTTVGAVTAKLHCVDAAREAALAAARGGAGVAAAERIAPSGASIAVDTDGDTAVATVTAPVPVLGGVLPRFTVTATAVAAVEPGAPPSVPGDGP